MDRRSSPSSLYPVGCNRHSCMFTFSVDEGSCKWHSDSCLAFKYARLYTTHRYRRCKVRFEGTELRKSYGKKEMKKMCHLFLSGTKKDSFVGLCVSKPSARTSSCGSRVSYGVIAFPTYMDHNFEKFTAARQRPVRS